MKKITILALHLGYGGIEKCISTLSNSLIDNYEIEIISTYKLYDEPAFNIDNRVKIKYLMDEKPNRAEIKKALKQFKLIQFSKEVLKAIKILKMKKELMIEAIKNCDSDVIISTRDIHNLWLSKYGNKNSIKIGWEHNYHNNNQKYINKIVNSVQGLDYFVLVSKELRDFYQKLLPNVKCVYIPNSLDYYPKRVSELDNHNLVSVGRLSKEKGFIDLIDVMKLVVSIYPDTILNIIGDGSERENIENKIKENMLSDNIKLHGFQDKEYINEILSKSSVYVMPSYTESFGIVLLEAFSFGVPCVAFENSGANEIISSNWDGYLIEDRNKEKMAKKICELLSNQNRRIIMGANGVKKALEYSVDNIKGEWLKIIEK